MSLLAVRNFRRFWFGFSCSQVGSAVTTLALPLAVLAAGGSAFEVSLVALATYLPVVLVTPVAGVLVDQYSPLTVARVTDLIRVVAVGAVPLASLFVDPPVQAILFAALAAGVLKGVGDTAQQSLLPTIVEPDQVVPGNAFVSSSSSVSSVAGPAVGGLAAQAITAVRAPVLDAGSFLFSWFMLVGIRPSQPGTRGKGGAGARRLREVPRAWGRALAEGFTLLRSDRVLLGLAIAAGGSNLFAQCFVTGFLIMAAQELGMINAAVGVLFGLGGLGGILGAVLSSRLRRSLRVGTIMSIGMVCFGCGPLLASLATVDGAGAVRRVLLVSGIFLYEFGLAGYNVQGVSRRQARAARSVLGRMTAAYRVLTYGSLPLGSVLAGGLASLVAAWLPVAVAGAGVLLWFGVLRLSPLRVAFADDEPDQAPASAVLSVP